jgi:hypothetical protein
MKTQQQAEREEQQRIKSLVLNYDLRDGEEQDGDSLLQPIQANFNIHKSETGIDKLAGVSHSRPDKSGSNRSGQRARKLQLSDVDWYGRNSHNNDQKRRGIPGARSAQLHPSLGKIAKAEGTPSKLEIANANMLHHGD